MDLGCIDLGCVEKTSTETSDEKENIQKESFDASASKLGKNNRAKDALRSSLSALNRLTSQISKPSHRKTSPINWFPRKKVEPYLKRKIKMLQEVDGMHSTLDETLGDSNPHYCRVLREKIAIREAAKKAMEAGKAAMVEASWCRILQAARIECKEAEARLSKAENDAAEAFEAARRAGVIMNDIPDCAQSHYKMDTTASGKSGGSMSHSISANFETAFDVDKQVSAAVKAAFIKLASSSSTSRDDFKELLRKISENPDNDENRQMNSDSEPDFPEVEEANLVSYEKTMRKTKKKQDSDKFSMDSMVFMMLDRLQCLKDDELASLATIVATSGLNAALLEMGTANKHASEGTGNPSSKAGGISDSSRISLGGRSSRRNTIAARNAADIEVPSLDKFLVKKLTRLEKEVLEARNGNKRKLDVVHECSLNPDDKFPSSGIKSPRMQLEKDVSDLASDQVKFPQRLENEEQVHETDRVRCTKQDASVSDLPSLDKFLVKHLTRLEREVLEAKSSREETKVKEEPPSSRRSHGITKEESNHESLDKVLVKHVSRLEREKQAAAIDSEWKPVKRDARKHEENIDGCLDQVLVKHKSRLEREKMAVAEQQNGDNAATQRFVSRKEARERELQAAWGGLSLGNSMQRHVSRLEKDKAAWMEAEEEERRNRALEHE